MSGGRHLGAVLVAAALVPSLDAPAIAAADSPPKPSHAVGAEPVSRAPVEIPAGKIVAGAWSPGDDDNDKDQKAVPPTDVAAFSIDRVEVTVRDYLGCVKVKRCPAVAPKKGCNFGNASRLDHPVNCVVWSAADAYCRWKGGRLPTSAEWERAARGDTNRKYPWGNDPPKDQLCWENERKGAARTCPVGTHPTGASPLGVLDMAGNVAEWTSTRFRGVAGVSYVIRGGGFEMDRLALAEDSLDYRTQKESEWGAAEPAIDLGFRCASVIGGGPPGETGGSGLTGAAAPAEKTAADAAVVPVATGSADRKPILDGVRAGAQLTCQFKVDWLKRAGEYAYFEGKESGAGASKPPATVRALVLRGPAGQWKTVEVLVAKDSEGAKAQEDFHARVLAVASRSKLPAGLFP